MTDKKRAALYARVSTEEQAREGFSLAAQIESMRKYCDIQDLVVTEEYIDDGFSGRNIKRKAYQRMFSPAERKNWDVLVVLKMDRIHRNSKNFMTMMEDLNKHGQSFISTYDRIDTNSATGRFVMDMIQRIAQLESEQIGERTYMGMKEKAVSGQGILGFNPPFGYNLENSVLVKVENELEIVTKIFDSYLNDMTMDEIAYDLNREGTLTRRGNPWNKFNIRTILHNPIYAGYMRWDGILQRHDSETAISPLVFNKVQDKISDRIRDPSEKYVLRIPIDNS